MERLAPIGCRFGQSLGLCSMILLVPSVILAVLVLAWIAWIAFEPRSTAIPSAHPSVHTLLGAVPATDEGHEEPESDYQRHVRNRIEESQLPLGTVAGASLPDCGRSMQRATDDPMEDPIRVFKGGELESHASTTNRSRLN